MKRLKDKFININAMKLLLLLVVLVLFSSVAITYVRSLPLLPSYHILRILTHTSMVKATWNKYCGLQIQVDL
jgi:hypothetical protein